MIREQLIGMLPPYRDAWVVIEPDQTVRDIIREVCDAHKEFGSYYNLIALEFDASTIAGICDNLYSFCKNEIQYQEEGDERQTTALPTGILMRGYGDCKHFASFCGGVLDAINRLTGKNIRWAYRFASYHLLDSTPHHVFVVVWDENGNEIWIDPTPGVEGKQPIWQTDRKVKSMALIRNIAGVGDVAITADESLHSITNDDLLNALSEVDTTPDLPEEIFNAINLLYANMVIDEAGNINSQRLNDLMSNSSEDVAQQLNSAYATYVNYLQAETVGNIFKDIWRGVKVATLAIPRNAYLGLVALNVFGLASKMKKIIDGPDRQQLFDKWYSLGGTQSGIEGAINSGAKKKAILAGVGNGNAIGVAPAAAAPAWLALAAGIIAAMAPLITSLLKKNNQYTTDFAAMDAGIYNYAGASSDPLTAIKNFVAQNPIVIAGAAALLIYFLWD